MLFIVFKLCLFTLFKLHVHVCLWDRFCLKESTHVCFNFVFFVAEKFEMSSTHSDSYVLRIGVSVIELHNTKYLVSHTFQQVLEIFLICVICSNNPIFLCGYVWSRVEM